MMDSVVENKQLPLINQSWPRIALLKIQCFAASEGHSFRNDFQNLILTTALHSFLLFSFTASFKGEGNEKFMQVCYCR
jgi:hypothetical protein